MAATILVAEDHPEHREYVVRLLRAFGFRTIPVSTAEEALHLARTEYPDLLLLDIVLRDGDGRAAARRLREAPETAHLPILAVSGLVLPRDREECFEAGCDAYLKKPFAPHELRDKVDEALRRRRPGAACAGRGPRAGQRRGLVTSPLGG